jgi:Nickel responsive protein SCO4226-like
VPLYMDVHHVGEGLNGEAVAKAHAADLAIQDQHGVDYKKYWVNEATGTIFCLVDAPNADAANTVHRDAHGLVADEIFEVTEHS